MRELCTLPSLVWLSYALPACLLLPLLLVKFMVFKYSGTVSVLIKLLVMVKIVVGTQSG